MVARWLKKSVYIFWNDFGMCVRRWAFRLHPNANLLSHLVQWCGFWPVWRNMWFFRFVTLLKPRLQTVHRWGQEPLWMYWWDFRSPGVGKLFPHSSHLCGFSCNEIEVYIYKLQIDNITSIDILMISMISSISSNHRNWYSHVVKTNRTTSNLVWI